MVVDPTGSKSCNCSEMSKLKSKCGEMEDKLKSLYLILNDESIKANYFRLGALGAQSIISAKEILNKYGET